MLYAFNEKCYIEIKEYICVYHGELSKAYWSKEGSLDSVLCVCAHACMQVCLLLFVYSVFLEGYTWI